MILVAASMPDINDKCEVIWAGLQFSNYFFSTSYDSRLLWSPLKNEQEALYEHTKSLSTVCHYKDEYVTIFLYINLAEMVIARLLFLHLLSGTLYQFMSGVPNHCYNLILA